MKSASEDASRQVLFRMANDRVFNLMWGFGTEEGSFLCECSRTGCRDTVAMNGSEYVRLRDRGEYVYAPGHGGFDRR
jgi:hypothetical protein